MHPHELPHEALSPEADLSPIPWSPEAESSVLGALMMDNGTWDTVGDLLLEKHFFAQRHRRVFAAAASLINSNKPADIITVQAQTKADGSTEEIELSFLNGLAQYVPSIANLRRHAEMIVEHALMRDLISASAEVHSIAITPGKPADERLEQAQALLQALQISRGRQMPQHISESTIGLLDRINDLATGNVVPGISTGLENIDRMLSGGLRSGKTIVLAARPSIGKSSLALQVCLNLARAGHGAAFLSQEMPNNEQAERVTSNIGDILLDNLQTGQLREDEWPRLTEAVDNMHTLPLFFDDQPALTLQDIGAKARMLKRQHDIKLLVLDYIQLCGSRGQRDKRHHEIEEISRGLKTLAKQLGITILILSQLGRSVESRASGRPILSDLKESGAIEEDADIVILMSVNQANSIGPRIIEAEIAKNRQGRIGSVALAFEGSYQRWTASHADLERKRTTARSYTEEA